MSKSCRDIPYTQWVPPRSARSNQASHPPSFTRSYKRGDEQGDYALSRSTAGASKKRQHPGWHYD